MTKFFMGFFALVLFAACNNAGKEETAAKMVASDLALEGLKGDISAIEESPYKTDSTGKPGDMDSCCISVWEYDNNGNNTKWTSKDSKGTVKETAENTRYPNGMWKGNISTKNGKNSGSFETGIDDKGIYISAVAKDSAGKLDLYYTNLSQNENGQVLTWKQYDKDSVYRQEGESKYDKNLQTSFMMKDSVGKLKSSSAYKYNDKGQQVEVSNTNVTKDSSTTTVTKYTYDTNDEMGNWTQRIAWNDKGKATAVARRNYTYRKK